MSLLKALGGAGASASAKLYPEDVFSTYLYTGNGSTQTINNGIDLAGKGGMVWIKARSTVANNVLVDTARGAYANLASNSTTQSRGANTITAFNSSGFTVTNDISDATFMNTTGVSGTTYASWTFRNADKFFKTTTKAHITGTASTVDLSSLGTVGMVEVKSTIGTSNWFTYHRSATSGKLLYLNLTNAETTDAGISVSGTTLTIAASMPSDTYVIYAWAHDTSADGIIQCGSYVGNSTTTNKVTLGFEPQYVLIKKTTGTGNWYVLDSMRCGGATLRPNTSEAELSTSAYIAFDADGFTLKVDGAEFNDTGNTYIYMAIRRPNKVPTSGTEVYNAIAYTGATDTKRTVGFPADSSWTMWRTVGNYCTINDRLRGYPWTSIAQPSLQTQNTAAEQSYSTIHSVDNTSAKDGVNTNTFSVCTHHFKRAKGFFDVVCYTGTGVARTVNHNLGVVPELIIVKSRNAAGGFMVYDSINGATKYLLMHTTNASAVLSTLWSDTSPTNTVFTVGTNANVNTSTNTYVAYLFATLAGISKVGSYTGNGTSQTINCGFTTGARFILIKRTDSTGDWYIWDTARGIVAGNDPHLSLNTTNVEVTTDDSIDPESSGFIVNQVAATNINVNLATYIYFSVS